MTRRHLISGLMIVTGIALIGVSAVALETNRRTETIICEFPIHDLVETW